MQHPLSGQYILVTVLNNISCRPVEFSNESEDEIQIRERVVYWGKNISSEYEYLTHTLESVQNLSVQILENILIFFYFLPQHSCLKDFFSLIAFSFLLLSFNLNSLYSIKPDFKFPYLFCGLSVHMHSVYIACKILFKGRMEIMITLYQNLI